MIYTASARLHAAGDWFTDGTPRVPLWALEALSPSPGPGATGTAMSTFLANEVLDDVLSASAFSPAGTLYQALFTVSPTDAGGGTEVSGGSYARQAITNNATNFPAASAGAKSNGAAVNFGTSTANWGTVGYIALIDNSVGGNYYFWGALEVSIPIQSGDSLNFPVGTITYALD